MSVNRCYSEKKNGFDVEARSLFSSLHDLLEIKNLTHVRYLCRYDAEGLAPETYEKAKGIVFSEPMADVCYDEDFPRPEGAHTILAVEPLPGQFDQRADSCAQCIQLLTGGERPTVAAAKIYVLEGELTAEDMDKIRGYLINPVDTREASMDKPATLKVEYAIPTSVASVVGFTHMDESALADLLHHMGLAMAALTTSSSCRPTSATPRSATRPSPRSAWSILTGLTTAATPPSSPRSTM